MLAAGSRSHPRRPNQWERRPAATEAKWILEFHFGCGIK